MPAHNTYAILQAAVALRDAGCTVVPTRKDGGKAPAGKWKDYQTTPPTGDQIADWFARQGHTGIGIITGKASRSVEMLELEGRAVEAGLLTAIEDLAINSGLAELYDRITQGWSERTPSGGIHWYYRITDGIVPGNTKLANDHDGLCLAETRGEGGFSVVAPSHGNVHPTGEPWTILNGGPKTMATVTFAEREAFCALFRAFGTGEQAPEQAPERQAVEPAGLRPGDDYNARASWDDILLPHGWTKAYTAAGVTYWVRPGKDARDGISATTGRNDGDNLFVFSSSTVFTTEKAYSKFAAYALLEHNGDYRQAATTLAAQGYGDQTPVRPVDELRPLPALTTLPTPATVQPADTDDSEESTWAPQDLGAHWDGTAERPQPTMLWREDGPGLLYAGRVHSFYGESESGKSWLAQIAAAETLRAHGTVVYIDFEADAADITGRLKLLGIDRQHLNRMRYLRPEAPRRENDPYWQELLELPANLVIIDGVTEALTMWGGETKDNDSITRWTRIFPRAIARATGAAVVTIDHVTKSADTRGRFAIGGQAKLAAIDGAAYLVEPLEALAPGTIGRLTVRVTKDRPGAVRAVAGAWRKNDRTQEAAVAVIDATRTPIDYRLEVPRSDEQIAELKKDSLDRAIVEYVIAHRGATWSRLSAAVHGDDKAIRSRLYQLIDDGYIQDIGEKRQGKPMILLATDRAEQEFNGQLRALNDVI